MDDAFLVCEPDDLGNLPKQVEPLVECQQSVPQRQKMIEPHELRIVLKNECRSEFVFGKSFTAENTGMLQRLQQDRFSPGRTFNRLSLFLGSTGAYVIDSNSSLDVLQR